MNKPKFCLDEQGYVMIESFDPLYFSLLPIDIICYLSNFLNYNTAYLFIEAINNSPLSFSDSLIFDIWKNIYKRDVGKIITTSIAGSNERNLFLFLEKEKTVRSLRANPIRDMTSVVNGTSFFLNDILQEGESISFDSLANKALIFFELGIISGRLDFLEKAKKIDSKFYDLKIENANEGTQLYIAISCNHKHIVKLLISNSKYREDVLVYSLFYGTSISGNVEFFIWFENEYLKDVKWEKYIDDDYNPCVPDYVYSDICIKKHLDMLDHLISVKKLSADLFLHKAVGIKKFDMVKIIVEKYKPSNIFKIIKRMKEGYSMDKEIFKFLFQFIKPEEKAQLKKIKNEPKQDI